MATYKITNDAIDSKLKPWAVCLTASLFFFYEFIQINIFNAIDPEVIKAFHINSTQLGFLSACYFFSTVAFLLPAGQILDRYSSKLVILCTLFICIIGIIGFSLSHTFLLAALFRFFEGIGSAFCFLGSFKIASRWFLPHRMAFITGVIVTIGMMGGVVAQAPLTILVESVGWRDALFIDSLLGLLIFLLIFLMVKDFPKSEISTDYKTKNTISYWTSLRTVYLKKHNWFCGIYTCVLNLPLVLLGALWGNLYLENAHHFTRTGASEIVTMLFIGTIIGGPVFGYLSDYIKSMKLPMMLGSFFSFLLSILIIYSSINSYSYYLILFLLLGFFSSAQILGYPAAALKNHMLLSGMSASVVSFTTMSGYIIFQPLFGWIINNRNGNQLINGEIVYANNNYKIALVLIPACLLFLILTLIVKRDSNRNSI